MLWVFYLPNRATCPCLRILHRNQCPIRLVISTLSIVAIPFWDKITKVGSRNCELATATPLPTMCRAASLRAQQPTTRRKARSVCFATESASYREAVSACFATSTPQHLSQPATFLPAKTNSTQSSPLLEHLVLKLVVFKGIGLVSIYISFKSEHPHRSLLAVSNTQCLVFLSALILPSDRLPA